MVRRISILILTAGMILSSCGLGQIEETTGATATPQPSGVLTPFHTKTPQPMSPTPTIKVQVPVTSSPTATPFLHTLTEDDTLLGLAFQYGVSLEDLQVANPGVDAHFLTVGKQIVIPLSGVITETLPTPSPVPIQIEQTQCYRSGEGGAWCMAAVHNTTRTSLENLSAGIGLYTPQGEIIASQTAYAPLNILRPGSTMPLMAYFAPPLPEGYQAHSEVLSGLAVATEDTRYLDLKLTDKTVDISLDGKQATVRGEVVLPGEDTVLSQLWLLVVAYDAQGDIIGARKWEIEVETTFEIRVYSLAGAIDHIEVLSEARP